MHKEWLIAARDLTPVRGRSTEEVVAESGRVGAFAGFGPMPAPVDRAYNQDSPHVAPGGPMRRKKPSQPPQTSVQRPPASEDVDAALARFARGGPPVDTRRVWQRIKPGLVDRGSPAPDDDGRPQSP
jgi:hypothetical protein